MNRLRKYILHVGAAAILGASVPVAARAIWRAETESSVRIGAKIRLNHDTPGRVYVNMEVVGRPRADVALSFFLPDEGLLRSEWDSGPGEGTKTVSEPHSGGVILHYTQYMIHLDEMGEASVHYSAHFGVKIGNQALGAKGPKYGYADSEYIGVPLAYLLPKINDSSISYEVQLDPGGYALVSPENNVVKGKSEPGDAPSGMIIGGSFTNVGCGQSGPIQIWVPGNSGDGWGDICRTTTLLTHGFMKITPFNVYGVSGGGSDAVFSAHTEDAAIMDLLPLTVERGTRLVRVLTEATIATDAKRVLVDPTEAWISYALPHYMSIQAAIALGQTTREAALGSIQSALQASQDLQMSLRQATSERPAMRNYVAENRGVLALDRLERIARAQGSTIQDLLRGAVDSWIWPWSRRKISALDAPELQELISSRGTGKVDPSIIPTIQLAVTPQTQPLKDQSKPVNLFLTVGLNGTVELCGCKVNQSGGMPRLTSYIRANRKRTDILVDLGGFLQNPRQDPLDSVGIFDARLMTELLTDLGYDAMIAGQAEFTALDAVPALRNHLSSANKRDASGVEKLFKIGEKTYTLVGWTEGPGVAEYENLTWLSAAKHNLSFDPEQLIKAVKSGARRQNRTIVMGNLRPQTITALTSRDPNIAAIITSARVDPKRDYGYIGDTLVVSATPGPYAVAKIVLTNDRNGMLTVQRTSSAPLDDKIKDDLGVRRRLDSAYASNAFLDALKSLDISTGVAERSTFGLESKADFVGSTACRSCHAAQYVQWKSTSHSTAMATLRTAHRNKHPGCLGCHVTAFGTTSGYRMSATPDARAHMENVGCESCHGPGSAHAKMPAKTNIERAVPTQRCAGCHNSQHSLFLEGPQRYVELVQH